MQQWWLVLFPMGAAAGGYLARRWIEGRRRSEALKRKLQALTLYQGMKRQGVTLDDLENLERQARD